MMRHPTAEWIAAAVKKCAHAWKNKNSWMGSQRERCDDLGFGWVYFGLARAIEARQVLVQGTGRGFAAACLALAIEHIKGSKLTILDAGYHEWLVDENKLDKADGIWTTQKEADQHFASLGLNNIELLKATSDAGYATLKNQRQNFDMILIDGDHGYEQCLKDLRNAITLVRPNGLILLHDAFCPQWPGVALAVDTVQYEDANIEKVVLPIFPGLAIVQKKIPTVSVRPIESAENEQVNAWRDQSGVAIRPLLEGDDPRPGQSNSDPRIGLFAILCDGQLAGGFGIRARTFRDEGEDDFRPMDSIARSGFLIYGLVVSPEFRGVGVLDQLRQEWSRWFGTDGYYSISNFPHELTRMAQVEHVGVNGQYHAYHIKPYASRSKPGFTLSRQVEYHQREMRTAEQLQQENAKLKKRLLRSRLRRLFRLH
jgi:predicted O-methyltransferase YrrM